MIRTLMLRLVAAAAIGLVTALVIARPVPAATLRAAVTVTGDVVTLGDLFDGAGDLADRPVFRSPDLGVEGALPAAEAVKAARAAGLEVDGVPVDRVVVLRASTTIDPTFLSELLRQEAADRLGLEPDAVEIQFDRAPETMHADALSADPVRVLALDVNHRNGRFLAEIAIDVGESARRIQLAGRADEIVEVPYLLRDLERDAVVGPADVELRRVPRRQVVRGAVVDLESVVGMAARRGLRAGSMVALSDVGEPVVVRRGTLVTLIYERPGLTLTARGRALGDAAAGGTVAVLNEQSRRTVHGVALATGAVRIEAQAPAVVGAALTQ